MARTLCPDLRRAAIAALCAALILFCSSPSMQIAAILLGGVAGWWLCRAPSAKAIGTVGTPVSRRTGVLSLSLFFALLIGLPLIQRLSSGQGLALLDAFYRTGALVFGGGHVVLPLLRDAVVTPGWVSDDSFLAGYGAAEAIPGPLFTFAAYLGAVMRPPPNGLSGAAIGLVAIFLPAALVLIGTLPFWDRFRSRSDAQAARRGVNAAVVGLLGAALYKPVFTSSVNTSADLGIALVGFVLLSLFRARPILIVVMGALGGIAFNW
jgi:chromate transporter